MKQKDKLGLPELRKYFDERRRKKDDDFVLEEPVKKQKEEAFLTTLPDTIGKSEIKSDLSGAVNSPLLLMKSSFMVALIS